jgi:hypothetical protein
MRFITALALVLLIPTFAFCQDKNTSSLSVNDEQELRSLVNKWNEAESKGDYVYIDTVLADEFTTLAGVNKKQYLSEYYDGILRIDDSVIEKIEVQIYGNTAIVTTLESFKTKASRKKFPEDKFWAMTVWIKKEGSWKCVKAAIEAVERNNQTASNN